MRVTLTEVAKISTVKTRTYRAMKNEFITRKSSVTEIFSSGTIQTLLDAYAQEFVTAGVPKPNPQLEAYSRIEQAGMMQAFCAEANGNVVGILHLFITPNPLLAEPIALTEAFFVLDEYNQAGAGIALLREAEKHATQQGAKGIFVSTAYRDALTGVLEDDAAYQESNRVFFRGL